MTTDHIRVLWMPGMRTKKPELADNRLLDGLHSLDKFKPVRLLDIFSLNSSKVACVTKEVVNNPAETALY